MRLISIGTLPKDPYRLTCSKCTCIFEIFLEEATPCFTVGEFEAFTYKCPTCEAKVEFTKR